MVQCGHPYKISGALKSGNVAKPLHLATWKFSIRIVILCFGRLLWTSEQSDAETSTWPHTTLTTDRHWCPGGFELAIPVPERPQTHALDRAATWDRRYLVIVYGVLAISRLTLNHGCFLPFHVLSKPPLTVHTSFRLCMLGSMESAV